MNERRNGVRGFSMWPNLIPGDILRASEMKAAELRPGMVAAFPGSDGSTVHRVVTSRPVSGGTAVTTAGDRSGMDSGRRFFSPAERVPVVTGVLRRGEYRRIGRVRLPELLSSRLAVRVWCAIVRRFLW